MNYMVINLLSFTFHVYFLHIMNKAYRLALALFATAATLSSCSRSNYAFNPATPAYLGSQPTRTVATAPVAKPAPVAVAEATPVVDPSTVAVTHEAAPAKQVVAATPSHRVASQVAPATQAEAAAPTAMATEPAKVTKPSLAQRLVLKKLNKQLAKAGVRDQNTASTTATAAKAPGITVAIIGLIALLVGIIASSGLVITLGAIVLVVGLVLLLLGAL